MDLKNIKVGEKYKVIKDRKSYYGMCSDIIDIECQEVTVFEIDEDNITILDSQGAEHTVQPKNLESIEQDNTYNKTYKGSEILVMIEDGRLKDDDILTADNIEYTFEEFEYIMIKDLLNYKFTIKSKPVDFTTAVNSGKFIRPVSLNKQKRFHPYVYWLGFMVSGCAYNNEPKDLINDLWEIKY